MRFYKTTFLHTLLRKQYFENNLKVLTAKKFYHHFLMTYAREQYRIVFGRSTNSEREEALFRKIAQITQVTIIIITLFLIF